MLATNPTGRAYVMIAEVEEGEHGDIGRARDWLSRAVRAPRDPTWTADGYVFDHWEPVSPTSGRIDAFEWKVPMSKWQDVVEDHSIQAELEQLEAMIQADALDIDDASTYRVSLALNEKP